VIGGGLRALIAGVERALGRGAVPPAEIADAKAAVAAARGDEIVAQGNPAGPERAAAHDQAVAAGIRAIETPEAPPVPTLPPPSRRVPIRNLNSATFDVVRAEVAAALDAPPGSGSFALGFGVLPDDVTKRILTQTGLDVRGMQHVMQRDELRHVWRRHGPEGDDIRVRPLTLEDLANLPRWLREAERFRHDGATHQGLPVLVAEKNLPDGTLVIVETVRAARSLLALKTAYFREGRGGPGTAGSGQAPGPPPPLRPERGPGAAAQNLSSNLTQFNAYTPTGRAVLLEPKVVDLDQIIVSHDAEGRPNPAYPHKEGVQPRERGAAPSQAQVRAIASGLIPERLLPNVEASTGPPIVSRDLVAETGNGRVAALALVYRQPEFAAQREAYLATLRRAGYDLTGLKEPVLVAERVSALSPAERAAFVREANKPVVAAETVVEQSRNDASAVAAALPRWRGGDVEAAANRDFVRAFVEGLTVGERSGLLDPKGGPTPALIDRIERALMQAAYGDALAPVLERLWLGKDEGMRGLAAALRQVAGDWAALRADVAAGRVPAEYDVTPALAEAVEAIAEAHARKIKLAELVEQVDIERPAMTAPARAMLAAWFPEGDLARRIKGQDKVAEVLRGYVERARLADPGPGLFSLPPPKPDDTLAAVARATGDAPQRAEPQAARLLAADDEARRLAALPKTERAELFEARRILADRDVALVVDDAGTAVSARALLDQAEREIEEASAATVCLIASVAA
jgi:hypothetical protein